MLSLKEQIGGFHKQIQKLDLAGYTSVLQAMSASQVEPSLREVISENHFLVETVRMMGNVFINYCWLNERVYARITEHQLGLHDEQARLAAVTQAVERKLDDSLRGFKTLHEDSLSQNRRNQEVVEVGLKSICQEIQTKVTDAQLNQKIRQILRKYDQGTLLDKTEEGMLTENVATKGIKMQMQNSPRFERRNSERKTGKVAYEDHYRLQEEFQAHFAKLSRQIHEAEHSGQQNKESVADCSALLDLHESQIKRNKNDIFRLQNEQKNSFELLQQQIGRIDQQLQTFIGEEQWRKRLAIFQTRSIEPLRTLMGEWLHQIRSELRRVKQETYLKASSAEGQLQQLSKELSDFRAKVAKEVEDVAVLELKFAELEQRVHQQIIDNTSRINHFIQQSRKNSKQLEKAVKKEVGELRSSIQKLSTTVQERAFKAIANKIESSFQCFQGDMMETREMIRSLTAGLALANEQVAGIKDVLSQKADFSDVAHYIQSKADKHDISQMRTRLNTNTQSHPVMVRVLSGTSTIRLDVSDSPRRPNRPKPPHTEFVAPATQRQRSIKADLKGTKRRLLVRESKNGVIKSYGSLINDLSR